MEPVLIIVALLAALAGAAAAWLYLRSALSAELSVWKERTNALQTRCDSLTEQVRLETGRRAAAEERVSQMPELFRALSAEALQSNNRAFLDLAEAALSKFQENARGDLNGRQRAIDDLVKPLRESLTKVDSKLHELEVARTSAHSVLQEQLKSVASAQNQLQAETANLVKALRMPATRGRWGELQLRRVVEMAGMIEHCDFREQPTLYTDDGRLRPDLVITLPNNLRIVVDAKVPLSAYLDAIETADEGARAARLRDHAAQVRQHVSKLAAKTYWSQLEASPEFVIAFLPAESFFSSALQHDPELIEYGVERRVLLATPTTLIALLQAVACGWRQERLAQNAQAVSELGREIYERLGVLAGYFGKLGQDLDRATRSYNSAIATLESRVLSAARRMKDSGIAVSADLPVLGPVDRSPRPLSTPELAGEGFEKSPVSNGRHL
jgi:DNA recombination protein RmuC